MLSLAEPPLPPLDEESVAQAKKTTSGGRVDESVSPGASSAVAEASVKYFKAVSSMLDDVGPRRKRGDRAATQYGLWLNRYARKIDKLSILNVDKDLLDYGANVSRQLRQVASQYRGVGVQAAVQSTDRQQVAYYPPGSTYYGGYGYGAGVYEAHGLSDQQIARKEGTAQAVGSGMTVFDQLDDATMRVRRLMTERYGIEF